MKGLAYIRVHCMLYCSNCVVFLLCEAVTGSVFVSVTGQLDDEFSVVHSLMYPSTHTLLLSTIATIIQEPRAARQADHAR